jgi:hypothetical protein
MRATIDPILRPSRDDAHFTKVGRAHAYADKLAIVLCYALHVSKTL